MLWLGVCVLSVTLIGVRFAALPRQGLFWDLDVYVRAVADLLAGANPYRSDVRLPFLYHPLVLQAFSLFGSRLFVALSLAYAAIAAWFLVRCAGLPVVDRYQLLLAASAIGVFGATSFASGNITTPMHLLLIAVVVGTAQSAGPSLLLPLLIVGLSLVKPYFLAYAILPVVLARPGARRRAIATVSGAALVLGLVVSGDYLARPALSRAFLDALSQLRERQEIGIGAFYFLTHRGFPDAVALLGHVALVAALAAATMSAFARGKPADARTARLMTAFLVYFLCTLLNPRLQVYDLFPAVVCLLFCCGLVADARMLTAGAAACAVLVAATPVAIAQFARAPESWPPLLRNDLLTEVLATAIVWCAFVGICFRPATSRPRP
jgi:hypothetical protein